MTKALEAWEATAAATAPVSYGEQDAKVALQAMRRAMAPSTPAKRQLDRQDTGEKPELEGIRSSSGSGWAPGACIPERKAFRKPRRPAGFKAQMHSGIKVLEGLRMPDPDDESEEEIEEQPGKYRRLASDAFRAGKAANKSEAILDRLASAFGEDYFAAPNNMKLLPQGVEKAVNHPLDTEKAKEHKPEDNPKLFSEWLRLLQVGFGIWVQGAGSKRRLLEAFADDALLPWGAQVVRMAGFNARFSTVQCLREILEQVHPGSQRLGSSADGLVDSIVAARKAVTDLAALRPLVLLVHNVEILPVAHQAALASLASRGRRVSIIASTDNIWAPLAWTPRMLDDFCFVPAYVNTHEGYADESQVRFIGGLPGWADPSADKRKTNKASLALVLRSLQNSHRELVQIIAEHQVQKEGRSGISKSALLDRATERVITNHAAQLKAWLNELKDHEVVVERNGPDNSILYMIACDDRTLVRLAEGKGVDGSDDEEE